MLDNFEFKNGWDYYDFYICTCYLSSLINNDPSGLDDDESEQFDAWVLDKMVLVRDAQTSHWACDTDSFFGRDDVTDLYGDVVNVRLIFKKEIK